MDMLDIGTQDIERKLIILTEALNLQTSLNQLVEYLDDVRVGFKYLVFDLEATERENKFLRKLLREENR